MKYNRNRLIYNANDCFATWCVFKELYPQLNDETRRVYEAEVALQGINLAVQTRGILVDAGLRLSVISALQAEVEECQNNLNLLAGKPLNPNSFPQLLEFFYKELGLREQKNHKTKKACVDETALMKIASRDVAVEGEGNKSQIKNRAAAAAELILQSRNVRKQISSLDEDLLENGRMKGSLKVGGTESFRYSGRKTWNNKGVNLQNVDKRLRKCYIPDPGFVLFEQDQASAESKCVAYLAGDEAYIKAHLEGSTHVTVGRLLWPEFPWPVDNKAAKKWAQGVDLNLNSVPLNSQDSVYAKAKRCQHGINYLMSSRGLAHHVGFSVKEAEDKINLYFSRFTGIKAWQDEIIQNLISTGIVQAPGYHRVFFGGRRDPGTHREAISFLPQSIIAWTNHIVFSRFVKHLQGPDFQVLNHIHDAILYQIKEDKVDYYLPKIKELSHLTWQIRERELIMEWEISKGNSWAACK